MVQHEPVASLDQQIADLQEKRSLGITAARLCIEQLNDGSISDQMRSSCITILLEASTVNAMLDSLIRVRLDGTMAIIADSLKNGR